MNTTPTPVPSATVRRPRPFRTYYYTSLRHKETEWARIGHACTMVGAIRAAVVKILNRHMERADIIGEDGVRIAWVRREKNRIVIWGDKL
jgi:hypothetical protein